MRQRWRRWWAQLMSYPLWPVMGWGLLWSVWRLLLLLILMLVAVSVMTLVCVETPSGTRMVLEKALGWQGRLRIVWKFGSLDALIGIKHLDWQGRSFDLHADDIEARSKIRELLQGRWPLDHLHIHRLELVYPVRPPTTTQLHRLWLPFELSLSHASLDDLEIQKGNKRYVAYRLVLPEARWSGTHLRLQGAWLLHNGSGVSLPFLLHLGGTLDFNKSYPLQATGWMSWPLLEAHGMRPWRLELQGDIVHLRVAAETIGGRVPMQVHGIIQLTQPYLPSQLHAHWQHVDWPWPESAQLTSAEGDMEAQVSTRSYKGQTRLQLQGRFVPEGLYRSQLKGDWQQLELSLLNFQGLRGTATGEGQLEFAAHFLRWRLNLTAKSLRLEDQWPVLHLFMPVLSGHWQTQGQATLQQSNWTIHGFSPEHEEWQVQGEVPAWVSRLDQPYKITAAIRHGQRTWPVIGDWQADPLQVRWQGTLQQYDFKVNGTMQHWAWKQRLLPQAALQLSGQGQKAHWSIQQIHLSSAAGQLDFSGKVWRNPEWLMNGQLTARQLDLLQLPALGWPVASQLQGSVGVQAMIPAGGVHQAVGHYQCDHLQVTGTLWDEPMQMQVGLMQGPVQGGAVDATFTAAEMQLGAGHISWNGQWTESLQLQVHAEQWPLAHWLPGISGGLTTALRLQGSRQHPDVVGDFTVSQPQWKNYAADQLKGTVNWIAGADAGSEVQFSLSGLRRGTQPLGALQAQGQGTWAQNQWQLHWTAPVPDLEAQLSLEGQWDALSKNYQGRLLHSAVTWRNLQWTNSLPSQLHYAGATQIVTLVPQCWQHAPAQLCLENSADFGHAVSLHLGLHDFPAEDLSAWMPEGLNWRGPLQGQMQVDWGPEKPTALHASVLAPAGQMELSQDAGKPLVFPYERMQLKVQVMDGKLQSHLLVEAGASGHIDAGIQTGLAAPQLLSGQVRVQALDVQPFKVFFPHLHRLQGTLNATADLSGSVQHPAYRGVFSWDKGTLALPNDELVLQEIHAQGQVDQQHLIVNGQFRSGDGEGQLQSQTDWRAGPWYSHVTLSAKNISLHRLPFVQSAIDAQLQAQLHSGFMGVQGKLQLKSAKILMQETGQSTLQPSADVVLTNEQHLSFRSKPWKYTYDLDVGIGPDVNFSGFNVEGQLNGHVHLHQDEFTPWDARGEIDLDPEATFRAYGQMLRIRKGRLIFVGPPTVPQVDVEGVKDYDPNITVGVRVTGWADQLTSTLISDNALSQDEISSYLVFGHAPERQQALFGVNNNLLPAGAIPGVGAPVNNGKVAALQAGTLGGQKVADTVGAALGVRDLAVTTQGVGTETQVALGGYLAPNLYMSYGVGVFTPVNSLTLRYRINDRFYLQASTAFQNALDLFYTWGF